MDDIIKRLEACAEGRCTACDYYHGGLCRAKLLNDAINAILSQRVTICRLQDAVNVLRGDNPVLTLEDLKNMDGQAVWCVDGAGSKRWTLVDVHNEYCTSADCYDFEFYEYGLTRDGELTCDGWLAYKYERI